MGLPFGEGKVLTIDGFLLGRWSFGEWVWFNEFALMVWLSLMRSLELMIKTRLPWQFNLLGFYNFRFKFYGFDLLWGNRFVVGSNFMCLNCSLCSYEDQVWFFWVCIRVVHELGQIRSGLGLTRTRPNWIGWMNNGVSDRILGWAGQSRQVTLPLNEKLREIKSKNTESLMIHKVTIIKPKKWRT